MNTTRISFLSSALLSVVLYSCADQAKKEEPKPDIREEKVTYTSDSVTLNGYIVYDASKEGRRPGVLVVHEWWGLVDYPRRRARELAELGYVAMAVDMYGNGKTATNPDDAGKMASAFYTNPQLTKQRFDAAMARFKAFDLVDSTQLGAIGYCFGGSVVLTAAMMGEPLAGVVSFHGGLPTVPASKDLLKAKIMVCHGMDDQFVKVEEVDHFKHQLDSIGAVSTVNFYPNATHAFSNPDATRMGQQFKMPIAYNAEADSASWKAMKDFFGNIFRK